MDRNLHTMTNNTTYAKQNNPATTERNHLIDAYRGFTMISMILYHACYDYFIAFGRNYNFLHSVYPFLWQQSICISFILVSGMVWPLGRKHALKRGLILIALGTAITLVTVIIMPSEAIHYGILTFMGIATLFTIPYDRALTLNQKSGKDNPVLTGSLHILICLILFVLTKRLPNGYIGTRTYALTYLPDFLYKYPALTPFGFPTPDFRSSDYFPVIPWIFMYILGYHLGKLLRSTDTFARLGRQRIPLLSWLGTKSLLVYIIHQPICFGLMWLICR